MTDIVRTNHVGFTVRDLDRAIAMFADLFGYAVSSRGGRNRAGVERLTGVVGADIEVVHLRREGLLGVELIAYREPADRGRAQARPCDAGYTHLTFDVTDLAAVMARAARHGLVPVGEVVGGAGGPRKGIQVVYLRDGDGINIELIQVPQDAPT
jgi:catechol 2,3-dioxygenase-like lactoylglutathione lyase family enzyme